MGRKDRLNSSITKTEQVFRRIFPPKVADFVEFTTQYSHKHRLFKGYVKEIRESKRGIKIYVIGVTYCKPLPRWGKPDLVVVKGNQGIKILEHRWFKDEEKK